MTEIEAPSIKFTDDIVAARWESDVVPRLGEPKVLECANYYKTYIEQFDYEVSASDDFDSLYGVDEVYAKGKVWDSSDYYQTIYSRESLQEEYDDLQREWQTGDISDEDFERKEQLVKLLNTGADWFCPGTYETRDMDDEEVREALNEYKDDIAGEFFRAYLCLD